MRDEDIHVHVHVHADDEVLRVLRTLEQQGTVIMADLSQLTSDVAANGSVIDSAVTLLNNLAQQIRDLSGDPAALADLAASLEGQSAALAAAVEANTAPAPEPAPAPAPDAPPA